MSTQHDAHPTPRHHHRARRPSAPRADPCDESNTRLHALLEQAAAAAPSERERLLEEAILLARPLAVRHARQYRGRGVEDEDLEQVALLGLCKAVRGYQPSRGASFAAYAVPTITGELKRHFRDCAWLVRPTRSLQELARAARDAAPPLVQELRRQPTRTELALRLGVSPALLSRAVEAERACWGWSLDVALAGGTGTVADALADDDDAFAPVEATVVLRPALSRLARRERQILDLRFRHGLTQEEIGAVIGVSQMQVSRLLTSILADLREGILGARAVA